MVDVVQAAFGIVILTVASPFILYYTSSYFYNYSLNQQQQPPSLTIMERSQQIQTDQKGANIISLRQLIDNEAKQLDGIDFKNKNPEQVLKDAYELRAQSEVDRCLSSNNYKDFCDYEMAMLMDSCSEPVTHILACDDPRLLQASPEASVKSPNELKN